MATLFSVDRKADKNLALQQEKKRLRALLRSQRRRLSPAEVQDKSESICEGLCQFPPFQRAQTIVSYSADDGEVVTEALWQATSAQGKAVYYPRITRDRTNLEFVRRRPGVRLIPGTFGILIPPGEEVLGKSQARTLVLTPGVGFDRHGHRLGRGKGYYDRAFRGVLAGAQRLALVYAFQVLPHIPTGPHDELVDYLVTETGLVECTEGHADH